ncbi:hypothetical protein LUZ61_000592 [Rhynchospora tenuis]|uniref:Rad21/Rec8-like protein N-terminal domain-containing protein n=1 Tax=Rhynchospora tenuis TaxID=198213 RepID=A0AAD5ZFF4_9POAL|nr:hypothetical protein LUZ61_000592 [Rhynchospora tenuis]
MNISSFYRGTYENNYRYLPSFLVPLTILFPSFQCKLPSLLLLTSLEPLSTIEKERRNEGRMFFSQALLWRKGPVANIWTAAYCFKKLKREQITQTDITSSVDQIINDIEISYRILAHLLLGIVRIFSKKVEFLEKDCNQTLKTLTESLQAIYWTNPKKRKHLQKQTTHVPETSGGGADTGMGFLESLQANSGQVGISIPARFELDLFDLEIADDHDVPEPHQQSAPQANNALNDRDCGFFLHETLQKESCYRIFSSTCFTPIEDVIPVEMMFDLDLEIADLSVMNAEPNASAEQHQESAQNLQMEDRNEEAGAVEPSVVCQEPSLKDNNVPNNTDLNFDLNALAEQHQESIQNLHTQNPNGEAEAEESSVVGHDPPLKDKHLLTEENENVPILDNLQIEDPLAMPDLAMTDPGLLSPKPMVRTPAKKESARKLRKSKILLESERKLRKRKISWCCDERTVLSNEVMRNAIDNPNDLVCKRGKVPKTCLEAWREERFNSVDQLFTEPLIPCTFSKVLARASAGAGYRPNYRIRELETPLNGSCENLTAVSDVGASKFEQSKTCLQESETVEKSVNISDKETSRFEKIKRRLFEPGTPEIGPQGRSIDSSDWVHERNNDSSGLGSLPDGATPRILTETPDATLSFLDSELGLHDGDGNVDQTEEGTVWSAHSRYVAHCLHQKASELKIQNQESCLSLEQMLEGKKRKICARFFYETLMLKGLGMIDVKQESPYEDINILVTPQLDEELRS